MHTFICIFLFYRLTFALDFLKRIPNRFVSLANRQRIVQNFVPNVVIVYLYIFLSIIYRLQLHIVKFVYPLAAFAAPHAKFLPLLRSNELHIRFCFHLLFLRRVFLFFSSTLFSIHFASAQVLSLLFARLYDICTYLL